MDSRSTSFPRPVEAVVETDAGSLHDFQELSSAVILFASPRPLGMGNRCHVVGLVQQRSVCLPSIRDDQRSPEQVPITPECVNDTISPILTS